MFIFLYLLQILGRSLSGLAGRVLCGWQGEATGPAACWRCQGCLYTLELWATGTGSTSWLHFWSLCSQHTGLAQLRSCLSGSRLMTFPGDICSYWCSPDSIPAGHRQQGLSLSSICCPGAAPVPEQCLSRISWNTVPLMQRRCWRTCHVFSFCPTICIFCLLRLFCIQDCPFIPCLHSAQHSRDLAPVARVPGHC